MFYPLLNTSFCNENYEHFAHNHSFTDPAYNCNIFAFGPFQFILYFLLQTKRKAANKIGATFPDRIQGQKQNNVESKL